MRTPQRKPSITTHLWYDKQAKEAAEYYVSVFPESKINSVQTLHDTPSGDCDMVSFSISGNPFIAISAGPYFKLNEAVSFIVNCETQEEIDYYWDKLSADPKSEQCGWCKDKFGLSWQIVPTMMHEIMNQGDSAKTARITQAFLKMKKFDIAKLKEAADGN